MLLIAISVALSLAAPQYLTFANLFNLLNTSAVNLIFAVGLLVVLISGGIDISFAVAASVVQYVVGHDSDRRRRRRLGERRAARCGGRHRRSAPSTPALIYYFGIISIVVTIATFNIFFGLLMFVTHGVSIYALPEWWTHRTVLIELPAGERALGRPHASGR